jgi:hypothetical protein
VKHIVKMEDKSQRFQIFCDKLQMYRIICDKLEDCDNLLKSSDHQLKITQGIIEDVALEIHQLKLSFTQMIKLEGYDDLMEDAATQTENLKIN